MRYPVEPIAARRAAIIALEDLVRVSKPLHRSRAGLALPVLLTGLLACGSGDSSPGGGDASPGSDASAGCPDPTVALPPGWRPVDAVTTGAVSSQAAGGGVVTTTVDASAGGFGNSDGEPFVYLDLSGGEAVRVDITDVQAYASSTWDIAFKRYVIRTNGGDSGPGGVEVALVAAGSLAEVTEAPPASQFTSDRFADPTCNLLADPLGAPLTVFSDWYDIENQILSPRDFVYVVRLRDGALVKVEIQSYYADPADPAKSGVFAVDWAPL